ncbi:unnamed protein product, partial [Symbiodinium natans]
ELARPGWNEPRKEKLVREMAVGFERKEREFEHQGAINACWLALGGGRPVGTERGVSVICASDKVLAMFRKAL